MRALMLLTAMFVVGCATEPTSPPTSPSSAAAVPAGDIQAQRMAAARNLNLKVVNKDGQQLFCRSALQTATRIQRDPVCYTADQLERLQEESQREIEQINNKPNYIKGLPQ